MNAASAPLLFYSPVSFWNTPIATNVQADANSPSIIAAAIAGYSASANFANSDQWGIALAVASDTSKSYSIGCTLYCQSGDAVSFAIPAGAVPSSESDHHLAVINGTQELDMWDAHYDAAHDTWSAGTRVLNDLTGWGATCPQGQHCNGAVAAGFAALGGVIRPEEIRAGHIDHALALFTPFTRAGTIACPATHTDGTSNDTTAIPEGARVQLDPAFPVNAQAWPPWKKMIATALQVYGAYVVDTAGSLGVRGVTDQNLGANTWASVGIGKGEGIEDLPWSQLRMLSFQPCN